LQPGRYSGPLAEIRQGSCVTKVGNQVLISSHRELLSSKAMVVNVAEKSEQDFDRHD